MYVFVKDYLNFKAGEGCNLPAPVINCLLNCKIIEKASIKPEKEMSFTEVLKEEKAKKNKK
jgi:hypothetical protein